jgi:hypothetical protein
VQAGTTARIRNVAKPKQNQFIAYALSRRFGRIIVTRALCREAKCEGVCTCESSTTFARASDMNLEVDGKYRGAYSDVSEQETTIASLTGLTYGTLH